MICLINNKIFIFEWTLHKNLRIFLLTRKSLLQSQRTRKSLLSSEPSLTWLVEKLTRLKVICFMLSLQRSLQLWTHSSSHLLTALCKTNGPRSCSLRRPSTTSKLNWPLSVMDTRLKEMLLLPLRKLLELALL